MSLITAAENAILDKLWGAQDFTPATSFDIALFTTAPDDAGAGGVEVSGGSYARVNIANNLTEWPAAAAGSKQNANQILFAEATALWGTVVALGFYAVGGTFAGTLMAVGTLDTPTLVNIGQQASFDAGDITLTAD